MKPKKIDKQTVLSFMLPLAIITGLATLIPFPPAKESSILGYKALCSFSPISTAILLYVGIIIRGYLQNLPGSRNPFDKRSV